jgi:hypothetical protein
MTIRTSVCAGGFAENRNPVKLRTLTKLKVRTGASSRPSKGLRIQSKVRAGGISDNHNATLILFRGLQLLRPFRACHTTLARA